MSTLTPLGLKKPAIMDYYDVADANGNMDLVDTLIGNNKTTADAKAILTKGTGTITTTGWVASATDYDFELTLSVSGILSTDNVEIIIDVNDLNVASDIKLASTNESGTDTITFYGNVEVPASAINFTYRVVR